MDRMHGMAFPIAKRTYQMRSSAEPKASAILSICNRFTSV
jgi:hypothetical protein